MVFCILLQADRTGAGSIFTLNIYPEPLTSAGVKAKGFK